MPMSGALNLPTTVFLFFFTRLQPADRTKEGSGNAECQDTEFGQVCLQQPFSAQACPTFSESMYYYTRTASVII